MDAQLVWALRRPLALSVYAGLVACWLLPQPAHAAAYRTRNFVVDAPTPQLAKEIGDSAENWRRTLAAEWLGRELPAWAEPCPIKALVSPDLGAGGATSFVFDNGQVFGWRMNIQGSRERVLDSVLPHEITHTIFASHFRQPLPRWADEGACTTVEHRSEIAKQEQNLIDYLKTRRGIPFSEMFAMKEYPSDVLPLYAQGHSLARYLIAQRGKQAFLNFLADGMNDENWPRAIREHYQYDHLLALQNSWMDWIRAGRPEIQPAGGAQLASSQATIPPAAPDNRSVVGAAMGAKQAEVIAAQPTADAQSSQGPQPVAVGRSVYGESASWTPSTRAAGAVARAAAGDAVRSASYDAAGPEPSARR